MKETDNVYGAVIPSAGYSSRMGRHKPLLPLGRGTVLESQIKLMKSVGINNPVVVAGFRADELMPAAGRLGGRVVINKQYDEGMFSSLKAGLGALDKGLSAFFLLPADIPLVTGIILLHLCRVFEEGTAEIVYPVFKGRRGHPPLISTDLIPEIIDHDGRGGVRTVLERHENKAADVETGNEGILHDMDTPEAYEDIVRRWELRQIPSADDCLRLLDEYNTPEAVRLHSIKTAELASDLCSRLNRHGYSLSAILAERAGLLHDIAKGRPRHAEEGARILTLYGYNEIARICGQHMDLDYRPGTPVTELEVLYLSDKLLDGTLIRPLEQRCAESLRVKGSSAEIREAVERRFASAGRIAAEMENILGCRLFTEPVDSSFS